MLKSHRYTYIPEDYSKSLAELKDTNFRWEMNFCSRTENKTIGHITHYAIENTPSDKCLILLPGLASNTRTEPLMKAITYWALTNKHDVYCLDTFLGDFLPDTSPVLAIKHTFNEYIDLIDTGLDVIEKDIKQKKYDYSCLIGHSAGATATFEIYNKRVSERKKLRFSASIMFAPYKSPESTIYIQKFFKKFYFRNEISDEDFMQSAIGIVSPHEHRMDNKYTKVSILPTFYNSLENVDFRPDLMDKYGIPITLVAGGLDKKSPPEELYKKYRILRTGKNGHLWKFVIFKDSKHSFINQYKDWGAILRLIQSQKRFAQKCKNK